jgi:hypothetical protein
MENIILLDINIFSDDDEDEENIRRPYMLRNKLNHFEIWDDVDFFARFRLRKQTVMLLLNLIDDQLSIMWNR